MPNSLLPPEERNLTPDQVEALDKRRHLGHTFLVIAGQFAIIATVLCSGPARICNTRQAGTTPWPTISSCALLLLAVFDHCRPSVAQRNPAHRLIQLARADARRRKTV